MIFIFSFAGDLSTDLVIDWLHYYQYPFFRFNSSDFYKDSLHLDILNNSLYFGEDKLPIEDIGAVWFRKFGLKKDFRLPQKENISFSISDFLNKEHEVLLNAIFHILKNKKWLTHYNSIFINKLNVLLEATKIGLNIPETYVINSVTDLTDKIKNDVYITKSLYEPLFPIVKNRKFSMYTKILNSSIEQECEIPSIFSPSLTQKLIEKKYEIRIFYLNGKFYSAAIFSQSDSQTKIDFRIYNWEKPNRYVPYKLPVELKVKLTKLMNKISLNCGSIDLIKGVDGKYYFLEVNPVGQFGMIDFPCNYNLHRKVAEQLIKMDKTAKK